MNSGLDELSLKQWESVVTLFTIAGLVIGITIFVDAVNIYDVYTFPTPPYNATNILGGIGAIASVSVSVLLLYVYDRQREILSDQKDLTEYQQTSLISIDDHKLVNYEKSKEYQSQNHSSSGKTDNLVLHQTEYLEVDLSNVGLAPAHDLRTELYIETDDETYAASLPLISGEWKEVISELHSKNKSAIFLNSDGNAIPSDSEVETHTVPLTVLTDKIPKKWKQPYNLHRWPPANSVIRCAEKNGDGQTTVALLLWYKDGRGTQGPQYIRCVNINPEEFTFAMDAVDDNDKEYQDGADLKEILRTGTASSIDHIPDIDHPEDR